MMYREPPSSGPLLVITFGNNVIALERRTGRVAWCWVHSSSLMAFQRLHITDERVFVCGGGEVVCLDYTTGAVHWSTPVDGTSGAIVVDGGEVFLGKSGKVSCLDAATGLLLWHHPFKGFGGQDVALGVPGSVGQVDL